MRKSIFGRKKQISHENLTESESNVSLSRLGCTAFLVPRRLYYPLPYPANALITIQRKIKRATIGIKTKQETCIYWCRNTMAIPTYTSPYTSTYPSSYSGKNYIGSSSPSLPVLRSSQKRSREDIEPASSPIKRVQQLQIFSDAHLCTVAMMMEALRQQNCPVMEEQEPEQRNDQEPDQGNKQRPFWPEINRVRRT